MLKKTVHLIFLTTSLLLAEKMDVMIDNPRVDGDYFKFDLKIKRLDDWSGGFGSIGGVGNCDFYFDYNSSAFKGDPFLENINHNIEENPDDYTVSAKVNLTKLEVKIIYLKKKTVWQPSLNSYETVCTVVWEVGDSSQYSQIEWDKKNSGFTDGDGDVISVEVWEGDGDIYLPVPDAEDSHCSSGFEVLQNYPNPFNSSTVISYRVGELSFVSVAIYTIGGKRIRSLIEKEMEPGWHACVWDGRDRFKRRAASGIYIVRIRAGSFNKTMSIVLLR